MKLLAIVCLLIGLTACTKAAPSGVESQPVAPAPKASATQTPPTQTPSPTQTPQPTPSKMKETTIKLNGEPLGTITQTPEQTTITWANGQDTQTLRLGEHVHEVVALKVIDLDKSQALSGGRRAWSALRTERIKNPALLFEVRHKFPPRKNTKLALRKHRIKAFTQATRTRRMLLSLRTLSVLWRAVVTERIGDGFGGYTVSNVKLVVSGQQRKITATRQDRQPARRSRCRQPKPYPIEYTQKGRFFAKTSGRPSGSPCGR